MQKLRRIAALTGAVLLIGMYLITLVFALIGSPASQNLLMAAIVCTVVIPVLLYAMQLLTRLLRGSGNEEAEDEAKKNNPDKQKTDRLKK